MTEFMRDERSLSYSQNKDENSVAKCKKVKELIEPYLLNILN